jgi:histone-lysine N-methyltransferase SETD3
MKTRPRPPFDVAYCGDDGEGGEGVVAAGNGWKRPLHAALVEQLRAYTGSVKEDTEELNQPGLSSRAALALRFRIGRQKMLHRLVYDYARAEGENFGAVGLGQGAVRQQAVRREAAAKASKLEAYIRQNPTLPATAARFNAWIEQQNWPVNYLTVVPVPGMRLGTVASRDVAAEELYISVPQQAVMNRESANQCTTLGPIIAKITDKYPRGDAFHELLFHLVVEKHLKAGDSKWAPYLAVIPGHGDQESPPFYTDEEMDALGGSAVRGAVVEYKAKIARSYAQVTKAVVEKFFPEGEVKEAMGFKNYKWAHAILDSRAIWWAGQRHLVPLLDMINCMEGPDPDRVHGTDLDAAKVNANTLSPWDFAKGEQVFENYGQPNHIYLMYHGFVLADNTHDCSLLEVVLGGGDPRTGEGAVVDLTKEELRQLQNMRVMPDSHQFCVKGTTSRRATVPAELLEYVRIKGAATARKDGGGGGSYDQARQALAALLQEKLRSYPQSLVADQVTDK